MCRGAGGLKPFKIQGTGFYIKVKVKPNSLTAWCQSASVNESNTFKYTSFNYHYMHDNIHKRTSYHRTHLHDDHRKALSNTLHGRHYSKCRLH